MKNTIKTLTLLALSFPFILVFLLWDILPHEIVVYDSIHGEDIIQSKPWIILIVLCLTLLPYIIFILSERVFTANKPNGYFHSIYPKIRFLIFVILSSYASLVVLRSADLISLPLSFSSFMLGVIMCFLGFVFPLLPQNHMMGVRTKWTLSSKIVWEKTHRFSRWVCLVEGSAMMVFSWVYPEEKFNLVYIFVLLLAASISISYSYLIYRQRVSKGVE